MDEKIKVKSVKDIKPKKTSIKKNDISFKSIMDAMDLDEKATRITSSNKHSNKFLNAVVPVANYNGMADLLHFPESKNGYSYLLVYVDLATSKFDVEPMKTTKSKETVEAMQQIVQRAIVNLPEISLKTDGGPEFKDQFNSYLKKHDIYHGIAISGAHRQMAPVERLNRSIARMVWGYINKHTVKNKDTFTEWTEILPMVRKQLNHFRERDLNKLVEVQDESYFNPHTAKPKYKIGDLVHYKLWKPTDIRGFKMSGHKIRTGDRVWSIDTKSIISILYYPDKPYFRFKLTNIPHQSLKKQKRSILFKISSGKDNVIRKWNILSHGKVLINHIIVMNQKMH